MTGIEIPNRDPRLIYPGLVSRVNTAIERASAANFPFAIFEGCRTPERQAFLYDQGRDKPGRVVTNAKAWESPHQAGLAVDLALLRGGRWSWEFTPGDVRRFFAPLGLEFLDFEAAHVQLTAGLGGKVVAAMARDHGIPHVWAEIKRRLKE